MLRLLSLHGVAQLPVNVLLPRLLLGLGELRKMAAHGPAMALLLSGRRFCGLQLRGELL